MLISMKIIRGQTKRQRKSFQEGKVNIIRGAKVRFGTIFEDVRIIIKIL